MMRGVAAGVRALPYWRYVTLAGGVAGVQQIEYHLYVSMLLYITENDSASLLPRELGDDSVIHRTFRR